MVLKPSDITVELAKELRKFAPFGEGNPAPKFLIRNAVMKNVNYMGKEGNHARFYVNDKNSYLNCVFFRRALDYKEILQSGQPHNLVGAVSYQIWNEQERVQFIVEEIM